MAFIVGITKLYFVWGRTIHDCPMKIKQVSFRDRRIYPLLSQERSGRSKKFSFDVVSFTFLINLMPSILKRSTCIPCSCIWRENKRSAFSIDTFRPIGRYPVSECDTIIKFFDIYIEWVMNAISQITSDWFIRGFRLRKRFNIFTIRTVVHDDSQRWVFYNGTIVIGNIKH